VRAPGWLALGGHLHSLVATFLETVELADWAHNLQVRLGPAFLRCIRQVIPEHLRLAHLGLGRRFDGCLSHEWRLGYAQLARAILVSVHRSVEAHGLATASAGVFRREVGLFLVLAGAFFLVLAFGLGLGTSTSSSSSSSGTAGSGSSATTSSSSTIDTAFGICVTGKNVCAGTKLSLDVEACAADPVA
jgi:hypothetical protein